MTNPGTSTSTTGLEGLGTWHRDNITLYCSAELGMKLNLSTTGLEGLGTWQDNITLPSWG
jgi:hypothetical protein